MDLGTKLEKARQAWDAEQWAESAALYEEVLAAYPDEPDSHIWWYDAALAYKFLRNWDKAFELGLQAARRARRGEQDPAFWNLAIAATIKREWAVARDAWAGYGLDLPPGEGEIDGDFGRALVRLDPEDDAEVVWVRRICPTRARVLSVPSRGRRFGEIVLHDGAPNGERQVAGRRYPVFDELMAWQNSETPTWWSTVRLPADVDMEALSDAFHEVGLAVEPAAGLVRHSRRESEGSVELAAESVAGSQDILFAAPDQATAAELLQAWAGAGEGRSWSPIRDAQGRHSVEREVAWPFEGGVFPMNLGAVVHKTVLMGELPALYVAHDSDNTWQAVDGINDATAESGAVGCMDCLTSTDPTLAELADLPPGWCASRGAVDQPWVRSVIVS